MNITGINFLTGEPVKLQFSGRELIGESHALEGSVESLPYIAPGLVDLQVNGFKGFDFNTLPISGLEIKQITESLWEQGVTTYFPTVITNSDQKIRQALKCIVSACRESDQVNLSIGGIHLEGPFISAEDGPRGAHSKEYVRSPDWNLFEQWQEAAEGKIKIITLSPEWPGSARFIEQCVRHDVKVAIGHTAATADQIKEAVSAGASLSTHLGNGCHQSMHRHNNYIWEQLASDGLWSSIIADGFHLPDSVLKVFIKVKPEKTLLVSDATSFTGLAPGVYSSHIGGEVELSPEGKLFIRDKPDTLAGSAQSLLQGVNQLILKNILPAREAWNMASLKPMEYLQEGRRIPFSTGPGPDFVLFKMGVQGIEILHTIKSGKIVFSKE